MLHGESIFNSEMVMENVSQYTKTMIFHFSERTLCGVLAMTCLILLIERLGRTGVRYGKSRLAKTQLFMLSTSKNIDKLIIPRQLILWSYSVQEI